MEENWKKIKGYEDLYEISNTGKVRSLHKRNKGKILRTWDNKRGYLFCNLCREGKKENNYIHRLVASHFVENMGNFDTVNHLDGDKKNNNFNNLEWTTHDLNLKHASKIGLVKQGEDHPKSKLNVEQVINIRKMNQQGKTNKYIAETYNMDRSTISRIVNRKIWKSI